MGNTVYRIWVLRRRVLGLLLSEKAPLSLEQMAEKLELPMYAVAAGIEDAAFDNLVVFATDKGAAQGWVVNPEKVEVEA